MMAPSEDFAHLSIGQKIYVTKYCSNGVVPIADIRVIHVNYIYTDKQHILYRKDFALTLEEAIEKADKVIEKKAKHHRFQANRWENMAIKIEEMK